MVTGRLRAAGVRSGRTGLIALVARRYFILGADRWAFALDIRPTTTLSVKGRR
jgi:hypothetical protein